MLFCALIYLMYYLFIFQTGHTALQRAAAEGHTEVVKHLLERGSPVDHQDEVVSHRWRHHGYASRKAFANNKD